MCKTNEAQRFLENYDTLMFKLTEKLEEKNNWLSMATNTTSRLSDDKVQTSSDQQKMESAIISYLGIEEQIKHICSKIREIEEVMDKLHGDKYKVIYLRYIKNMTFAEIGIEIGKTETSATTIHGRALQDVQGILNNGRERRI